MISNLIGKTVTGISTDDDEVIFRFDGGYLKLYHRQDCCEHVYLEDVCGDLEDLIGSPILMAEESITNGDYKYGSYTATFYKFATLKGYVTLLWRGESNGYYSESVDIQYVTE